MNFHVLQILKFNCLGLVALISLGCESSSENELQTSGPNSNLPIPLKKQSDQIEEIDTEIQKATLPEPKDKVGDSSNIFASPKFQSLNPTEEESKEVSTDADLDSSLEEVDKAPLTVGTSLDIKGIEDEVFEIELQYTHPNNLLAESCGVYDLKNIKVTEFCKCDAGVCKLSVQGFPNYVGRASLNFIVQVGDELSELAPVKIFIEPVNDNPIIGFRNPSEGFSIFSEGVTFELFGSDLENDPLSYELISASSKANVEILENYLLYRPTVGGGFQEVVEAKIKDSQGGENTFAITMKVQDWWHGAWKKRIPIEIDATPLSEDLTHFPVLVRFDSSHFDFTDDILKSLIFVSEENEVLPIEVDYTDLIQKKNRFLGISSRIV